MQYPRGAYPPPKCPECRGTGRVLNERGADIEDCTGCNGTGIEGNPHALLIICGLVVIGYALLYLLWKG